MAGRTKRTDLVRAPLYAPEGKRACPQCGILRSDTDFYARTTRCKPCVREDKRRKRQEWDKCRVCNKTRSPKALYHGRCAKCRGDRRGKYADLRRCIGCDTHKPVSEFYERKHVPGRQRYTSRCKPCHKANTSPRRRCVECGRQRYKSAFGRDRWRKDKPVCFDCHPQRRAIDMDSVQYDFRLARDIFGMNREQAIIWICSGYRIADPNALYAELPYDLPMWEPDQLEYAG